MPIPSTRAELTDLVSSTFAKLQAELDDAGPRVGGLPCVDDWSVKDVLAVRVWWTENVVDWIEAGLRDENPVTPAKGYRWRETPRLNADIVQRSQRESYRSLRTRLQRGYEQVMDTIDSLDDEELLGVGTFSWAGKYPISRWLSINTARQYTSARSFIRRALRQHRNMEHDS